ncbi:hypothetical protein ACS0TY_016407 [Phlomoides rotata]
MRAGGSCSVQQALTPEAAGIIKQAVVLARRRGHAQVTPLHVANTMLAASSGLFRVACLESHSHPLQCKALELCFNVALNRLPASSSNPMLGPHSSSPSISNALVAAFKRAQAHQRRGSIESQQQPILTVKIELEQLIISILDDPSVSRVMKEAGFTSTQVKTNVEKAVSLEFSSEQTASAAPSENPREAEIKTLTLQTEPVRNEDVKVMMEALLMSRKKKSLVFVGECISTLEKTVQGLMGRVEKGDVPEGLREVKFISVPPLYSFCNLHREEVEQKIRELTCVAQSFVGKGVVLYLGDLKWISDYRVSLEQKRSYYCSVEHMIMEIGRLVWGIGEIERFWVVGIATFQSYMRCRNGYHSLESVWGLHPVTIPANTLGFSLVSQSDEKSDDRHRRVESFSSPMLLTNGEVKLSCCNECSAKFEDEAGNLEDRRSSTEPAFSSLPSWLQNESRKLKQNDQNYEAINELRKKWNSFCSSAHKQPAPLLQPNLAFSFDQQNSVPTRTHFPLLQTHCWTPNLLHIQENANSKNTFSSTPNSASSSDIMDTDYAHKFKEFNAENLNILCNALEEKVPSQRGIIPEIAGTILQCRSGMLRRKDSTYFKEETWLFFLGPDESQSKEKIARELAKIVFGSYSCFVSIGSSSFGSPDDCRNKRGRDERMSYVEWLARSVSENPHRVFFIEEFEEGDYWTHVGIKRAIESGKIGSESGDEVGLCDAIIILSCERFRSRSRASSPRMKSAGEEEGDGGSSGLLDLNISFGDGEGVEEQRSDELGILEVVDRRVVFKIQEL